MTDHAHCHCFPVCYSETHIGYETDKKGKLKEKRYETETRDTMCCHCGHFKEGKMVFVQEEGHGILRHCTRLTQKERK